ncbi:MAG: hypothetical protein AAGD40_08055 [Pseudomonadota bacterium]
MADVTNEMIFEILKKVQSDVAALKREQSSQSLRMLAIEEHQNGMMTSIYGVQSDLREIKERASRIEDRLGLAEDA